MFTLKTYISMNLIYLLYFCQYKFFSTRWRSALILGAMTQLTWVALGIRAPRLHKCPSNPSYDHWGMQYKKCACACTMTGRAVVIAAVVSLFQALWTAFLLNCSHFCITEVIFLFWFLKKILIPIYYEHNLNVHGINMFYYSVC